MTPLIIAVGALAWLLTGLLLGLLLGRAVHIADKHDRDTRYTPRHAHRKEPHA